MFKSFNIHDGTEVIILDHKWLRDIESLRVMARQDLLVCQGCNYPVSVRAGQERRPHFAHKNLGDCTYVEESQTLRNARAVLYEWLVSKFGENVTIEKKIDSQAFPRPIDCWVEKDSKTFAYWIFDKGVKLEKRMQLFECFQELRVNVNYVFSIDMLRKDDNYPDSILLTTTEREFLSRSDYDLGMGHTLQYLNPDNRQITTFRGLNLVHQPQVYSGFSITSSLDDTLVSPKNGEFVHKGDLERLQQHREELAALEKRRKEAEEHNRLFALSRMSEFRSGIQNHSLPVRGSSRESERVAERSSYSPMTDAPEQGSHSVRSLERVGVCVSCGVETSNWFTHWFENGVAKCKCNLCLRQGKFG
jgi:Competence protein CoiA-like family